MSARRRSATGRAADAAWLRLCARARILYSSKAPALREHGSSHYKHQVSTAGGQADDDDPRTDGPEDRRAFRLRGDESVWSGKAPGKPFGLDGKDRPLEFRLLHIIEFAGNGDIQ